MKSLPTLLRAAALPLALLTFSTGRSPAQIRITEVNISTQNVEITNFGSSTVTLTSWRFCHRFFYPALSGAIAPGESRQFHVPFNQTSSDLGLYSSSSFASTSAMEDFIQWGAGGIGRESVAVSKGIWVAGQFLTVPAAGLSFHAKGLPGTGSRIGNWFTAMPHAGFPLPPPVLESASLSGGSWTLTVQSHYLSASLLAEVNTALSGTWTNAAATKTDLTSDPGLRRVRLVFPAGSGPRQFARIRAAP